jgi:hypothetical protein
MKRILSVMIILAVAVPFCHTAFAAQGSVNSNNAMGEPAITSGETAVPDGTTYATGTDTVRAPGTEDVKSDGSMARTVLISAAVIAGIALLAVIIYLAVKKTSVER